MLTISGLKCMQITIVSDKEVVANEACVGRLSLCEWAVTSLQVSAGGQAP